MLKIKGYFENDTVKIEVVDDGVGMDEELIARVLDRSVNAQRKSDFGVYSVDSRIKLLYGEQYGIGIESRVGEYTKVTVTIPALRS